MIYIWSVKKKNKAIEKLLSNYWKISILYFISLLLIIGKENFSLLFLNISNILMTISIWFWSDINNELKEYKILHPLAITTKVWRWVVTFLTIILILQSYNNLSCIYSINSDLCINWIEPSKNLYLSLNKSFNFLFGANFTEPIAKFTGSFAFLIYIIGLFQWLIIELPRTGRNSGFANNEIS